MDISKFKTLKQLHEYYNVNNKCKLKDIATQAVYETTPPKSGVVFIGEAPGRDEDLQGKPFVGAAGKLLDELLKGIKLKRDDVYVSNVVKYRPPNNREPTDKEKNSCRIWLNAELLFINPKVIIPLGRHALERFVEGIRISTSHGQAFKHSSNIPIFAMYHPAVALYNPPLKNTLIEDFKKLKIFLENDCKDIKDNSKYSNSLDKKKEKLVNDILEL